MTDDIQTEIARLTADMRRKQDDASKIEAEISAIEKEMDEFRAQYEKIIHPVEAMLDAVNAAIEQFEEEWRKAYFADAQPLESWTEPGEYVPVEEQYRRVWGSHNQPPPDHVPESDFLESETNDEGLLKRLFRALARRYHPDFAADDTDREYRTRLMAMINEAYAAHDTGTLQTLMNQDEHVSADVPLAVLRLRDLKQSAAALERRIAVLESERSALLHSEMMQLKVEYKLARLKGRDLLREMAAQLEQDYWAQVARLDQLRNNTR